MNSLALMRKELDILLQVGWLVGWLVGFVYTICWLFELLAGWLDCLVYVG